jgi:hypothetical protein
MKFCFNSKIFSEDLKLLDSFASFTSTSLEKNELEEIAQYEQKSS